MSNLSFFLKKYKPTSPGIRHKKMTVVSPVWKDNTAYVTSKYIKNNHIGKNNYNFSHLLKDIKSILVNSNSYYVKSSFYCGLFFMIEAAYDRSPTSMVNSTLLSKLSLKHYLRKSEESKGSLNIRLLSKGTTYYKKLKNIKDGTAISMVEMYPGEGPSISRASGTYAVIIGKKDKRATIKMPSGEIRVINANCYATIGPVSNEYHKLSRLGKAGANRWSRVRVRGIAKNPVDHPHGGRTNGGKPSVTPSGKPTKGQKTRKKSVSIRQSNFILSYRK